jgi:hypothetical protein
VATVRASCPTCGDFETSSAEVTVLHCFSTGSSVYALACPSCGEGLWRSVGDALADRLVEAGARLVHWSLPLELVWPDPDPPVSHDDLLEFHLALAEAGRLEEAVGALRQGDHPRR